MNILASEKEQIILTKFQELPTESKEKVLELLFSQDLARSFRLIRNIQINHYVEAGFPKALGISCRKFSEMIPDPNPLQNLAKALLIVPENLVSLEKQLMLLDKIYQVELKIDLRKIRNLHNGYEAIHWIYEVDYGKNFTPAPIKARVQLQSQKRRGLNFGETLNLIFQHSNILKSHFLLSVGAAYQEDYIPYFSLSSEKKLLIGARSPQCNMACFGIPSCKF